MAVAVLPRASRASVDPAAAGFPADDAGTAMTTRRMRRRLLAGRRDGDPMTRRAATAAGGVLATIVLALGCLTTAGVEPERNRLVLEHVRELRRVDARFKETLVIARYSLAPDAGVLLDLARRTARLQAALEAEGRADGDRRVRALTRKLGRLVGDRPAATERLIADVTALGTALRSFPEAATRIERELGPHDPWLHDALWELVQGVLALNVSADHGDGARVEGIMWAVRGERQDLDRLVADGRWIVAAQRDVDDRVHDALRRPTDAAAMMLERAVQARIQGALVLSDRSRRAGYAICLVLLGCLLVAVWRLSRNAVALRAAVAVLERQTGELDASRRSLEVLNHDLEARVRERTAELACSEAAVQAIIASLHSFLVGVDGSGIVRHWNRAAEELFAIPAARVLGQPWTACGLPWNWTLMGERIARMQRNARWEFFDDVVFTRADGRTGVLGVTFMAHPSADGGFVMVGDDVSERRELEVQLHQAQRLESVGRLAAGIAHEINTPIQFVGDNAHFVRDAMASFGRLLAAYRTLAAGVTAGTAQAGDVAAVEAVERETDARFLEEEIPRALDQTLDGVSRVASIVRAMKEFAHPDSGEKVPADLNQALLSTLTVARNELKYVADVATDLGDLPSVPCLVGELNQAFLNILVNAAHAIQEVVGESGARGRIGVRTWCEPECVVVAISDTGPGIPDEVRSKIFDPFFTTKEVGKGTGQGLAIARHVVVEKHGGVLTCETEVGKGTTFHVRLPVVARAAGAAQDAA
jgi:PAS domain S-box-containing protein